MSFPISVACSTPSSATQELSSQQKIALGIDILVGLLLATATILTLLHQAGCPIGIFSSLGTIPNAYLWFGISPIGIALTDIITGVVVYRRGSQMPSISLPNLSKPIDASKLPLPPTPSTEYNQAAIEADIQTMDRLIEEVRQQNVKQLGPFLAKSAQKDDYATFFQAGSQQRAKFIGSYLLRVLCDSVLTFPTGEKISLENTTGTVDKDVFHYAQTTGVQNDIPNAIQDTTRTHIFGGASQYNGCEAPSKFLVKTGLAMTQSNNDPTQGPKLQRTNPWAFEIVTLMANLGFNMLHPLGEKDLAVDTSADQFSLFAGYLCPKNPQADLTRLADLFQQHYDEIEYICYSSLNHTPDAPWSQDGQPIWVILQAAPAIGYSPHEVQSNESEDRNRLEAYAALANITAFFRGCIQIAQEQKKPVCGHYNPPGGGCFRNKENNLFIAIQAAALHYQAELKANQITIQFECKDVSGTMGKISQRLGLDLKNRIG